MPKPLGRNDAHAIDSEYASMCNTFSRETIIFKRELHVRM